MHRNLLHLIPAAAVAIAISLISGCSFPATRAESPPPAAVPIILDTDIGTDVDDAGALAMLHALASRGEARILAVMSCNRNRWCGPAIDVINTYYGRTDIPIGASRTGPDDELWYHDAVPAFPHRLATSGDAPEAVSLYRRILAAQPDHSVTIVAVGWLTNMSGLLNSPPDSHSALSGRELIAAKVKELVSMGGVWPNNRGEGEYNFTMDRPAAHNVLKNWPGPITFTGLGRDVMTGRRLMAESPADNPVRAFYDSFLKANKVAERSSWDQIAVLYAVRGLRDYFASVADGRCVPGDKDVSAWVSGRDGKTHGYLVYRMPQAQLAMVVEDLMLMPVGAGAAPRGKER